MSTPRRHISPAGIVVAVAVVAAISVVIWVLLLVRNEESPIEPSPEVVVSPVSSPASTPVSTTTATPVATFTVAPTVAPGSLPDLMRYAPDRLVNNTLPLSDIARYANIAGWMAARGIETPENQDDPSWAIWEPELDALALPDVLHARGNEAIWNSTYGFALTDVHAVLAVGQAPDYVLIMQGDFDPDALNAAWVQSGYQAVREQGYTIWSLFPGQEVDLSAPASRPALGNMNNVVLLEDGTLIATSRLSRMEETLKVVTGNAPSLGQNPQIASLLTSGGDAESLATAIIAKGSLLATDPSTPAVLMPPGIVDVRATPGTPMSTPVAEPPMPPVDLMLAGITPPKSAGDIPVMSLVVSYESADEAVRAMKYVDQNLSREQSAVTGEPYTRRIQPLGARVVGTNDGTILVIRFRPLAGAADWLAIIDDRDLGFLMWPWEP